MALEPLVSKQRKLQKTINVGQSLCQISLTKTKVKPTTTLIKVSGPPHLTSLQIREHAPMSRACPLSNVVLCRLQPIPA